MSTGQSSRSGSIEQCDSRAATEVQLAVTCRWRRCVPGATEKLMWKNSKFDLDWCCACSECLSKQNVFSFNLMYSGSPNAKIHHEFLWWQDCSSFLQLHKFIYFSVLVWHHKDKLLTEVHVLYSFSFLTMLCQTGWKHKKIHTNELSCKYPQLFVED